MECKLCLKEKKLIEAHIIPRSFYKALKKEGRAPVIINDQPGMYPKKSQTGIYDKGILCEDCEKKFSVWDDYGYKFLTQELKSDHYIQRDGKKVAYRFNEFDFEKLVMFFLSVLWRADVTSNKVFYRVQLGPYEELLRKMIIAGKFSNDNIFSVALSKFDVEAGEIGVLDPDRTEYEGVNHYRLYLDSYIVLIKVTNKEAGKQFKEIYLKPDGDAYCVIRSFRDSKEYKAIEHTKRNSRLPASA